MFPPVAHPVDDSRAGAESASGAAQDGASIDPALGVARQVVTDIAHACDAKTMPATVCDAYGQLLGSFGQ